MYLVTFMTSFTYDLNHLIDISALPTYRKVGFCNSCDVYIHGTPPRAPKVRILSMPSSNTMDSYYRLFVAVTDLLPTEKK